MNTLLAIILSLLGLGILYCIGVFIFYMAKTIKDNFGDRR